MSKITLANLANILDNSTAATVNANSAIIQTAMDNTLSRDGTIPNTMSAAIDMNSNQILNLPTPGTVNSPARLIDVTSNPTITVPAVATATPLAATVAGAVGTSVKYAREDHQHPGFVIRTQSFVANGTYTPNANMLYCIIEAAGGGGGGGGATGIANAGYCGGGGGGGGYSKLTASKATIGASKAIVIGTGGAGTPDGLNVRGTTGGTTTVGGTLVVANGGQGGIGGRAANIGGPGNGGAAGTGDIALAGSAGAYGDYINSVTVTNYMVRGGYGGPCNFFGPITSSGVANVGAGAGVNGTGNGSGGSGAATLNSASSVAGGNGADGKVFITEFCSA